jgi:hypothetical protein
MRNLEYFSYFFFCFFFFGFFFWVAAALFFVLLVHDCLATVVAMKASLVPGHDCACRDSIFATVPADTPEQALFFVEAAAPGARCSACTAFAFDDSTGVSRVALSHNGCLLGEWHRRKTRSM